MILLFGYNVYRNSNPLSQVTVEGVASQKIKYDEASIIYYVQKEGVNTKEQNDQVNIIVKKVTDYLLTKNIQENDIKTNKNSYQSYNFEVSANGEEVFVSQGSIEVTFKDIQNNLELPNEITDEVTNLGVTNFSGYTYKVSNQEELCEDLKSKAIKDASQKAEERVEVLDGGKIIRKSTSETSGCDQDFFPYYGGGAQEIAISSDKQAQPQPVFTGEQELEVRVQLVAEYR
ncbi:SIMPL domain-containing protein [Candidatus Gracilibacteria bacterium]|nr:SIMPL domain-containing protein [Candidatus Gracilibacteria bacterium]